MWIFYVASYKNYHSLYLTNKYKKKVHHGGAMRSTRYIKAWEILLGLIRTFQPQIHELRHYLDPDVKNTYQPVNNLVTTQLIQNTQYP